MIHSFIVWAKANPLTAIGYTYATLTYIQTSLENLHAKLGWEWANRAAIVISCLPLSGSASTLASAFRKVPKP